MIKLKVTGEKNGITVLGLNKPKRPDLAKRNAKRSNLNQEQIMATWNHLRETTVYGDVVIDQIIAERINEKLKKQKRKLITASAITRIRLELQIKDDPFSDPRYE